VRARKRRQGRAYPSVELRTHGPRVPGSLPSLRVQPYGPPRLILEIETFWTWSLLPRRCLIQAKLLSTAQIISLSTLRRQAETSDANNGVTTRSTSVSAQYESNMCCDCKALRFHNLINSHIPATSATLSTGVFYSTVKPL
jgi:hypothetical protein